MHQCLQHEAHLERALSAHIGPLSDLEPRPQRVGLSWGRRPLGCRRALGWPLLTLAGLVNVLGLWGSAFGVGMLVSFPLLLWVAGFGGVACAAVSTVPIGWLWVRFVWAQLEPRQG